MRKPVSAHCAAPAGSPRPRRPLAWVAAALGLAMPMPACGTVDNPAACSVVYPDCGDERYWKCDTDRQMCVPVAESGIDGRVDIGRVDAPADPSDAGEPDDGGGATDLTDADTGCSEDDDCK